MLGEDLLAMSWPVYKYNNRGYDGNDKLCIVFTGTTHREYDGDDSRCVLNTVTTHRECDGDDMQAVCSVYRHNT